MIHRLRRICSVPSNTCDPDEIASSHRETGSAAPQDVIEILLLSWERVRVDSDSIQHSNQRNVEWDAPSTRQKAEVQRHETNRVLELQTRTTVQLLQ
eukprot:2028764-Amphidinium_carterae.2